MEYETFQQFFKAASEQVPYDYQVRLADEGLPPALRAPTGAGKTAAVVLAHLWRRRHHPDRAVRQRTPRRLIIAQPMRTLTEQTERTVVSMLEKLGELGGPEHPDGVYVHVLMGGRFGKQEVEDWRFTLDRDAIVIGTVDSVVSRALMRGYGASRPMYPVEFALVTNGAHVVMDETQLACQATKTMRQIAGMRQADDQADGWGTAEPAGLTCMSATLDDDLLNSVDNPFDGDRDVISATVEDGELATRARATRHLREVVVANPNEVAEEVWSKHRAGTLTLVVLNTVKNAVDVHDHLTARLTDNDGLDLRLVHSRYRPLERKDITATMGDPPSPEGRIIVATQAVEAGVDLNARLLLTEAAPWSSICQRIGRTNRDGSLADAEVLWCHPLRRHPYDDDAVSASVEALRDLEDTHVTTLDVLERDVDEGDLTCRVLRRKDFLALFDTAPDLHGRDLDVASYIRDIDERDVSLIWVPDGWFDLDRGGRRPPVPGHVWRCAAPIDNRLREWLRRPNVGKYVRIFSPSDDAWVRADPGDLRPGAVLVVEASAGGYSTEVGLSLSSTATVEPVPELDQDVQSQPADQVGASDEPGSVGQPAPQSLIGHSADTRVAAEQLLRTLQSGLSPSLESAIEISAFAHDCGKAHPVWQEAICHVMEPSVPDQGGPWAKSGAKGALVFLRRAEDTGTDERRTSGPTRPDEIGSRVHTRRVNFRHEVVSALSLQTTSGRAWLLDHGVEPEAHGLCRYLVAAHHGIVRILPPNPTVDGVIGQTWLGLSDDDPIPWCDPHTGTVVDDAGRADLQHGALRLKPDPKVPGAGEPPSWSETSLDLLNQHGPFVLAWMESVVRIADMRASAHPSTGVV